MNNMYVLKLYSRESLNKMSKSKKKLYKLLLVALANNLLRGCILNDDSREIINQLDKLLEEKIPANAYDTLYENYNNYIKEQINKDKLNKLTGEESFQKIIRFTRKTFKNLVDKNVSIHRRSDVEQFIEIDNINGYVNWIGISVETGCYPVVPEKLVWYDFKIIWNTFAKYKKKSLNDFADFSFNSKSYERAYNKESRLIDYTAGTMERGVLVSCITFIESYLYNIRMMIKENILFKDRIKEYKLNNILKKDKINDTEIIECILFKIYPDMREIIKDNYKVYKELLKLRDRYIHISLRTNESNEPEMLPLISYQGLNIEFKIKNALKLVDEINKIILKYENIDMLWWRKEEECNFEELQLYKVV